MILDPTVGDVLGMCRRTFYDFYYLLENLGWQIVEYTPQSEFYDERFTIRDLEQLFNPDIIASWDIGVVKKFMPKGTTKNVPYIVFCGDYDANKNEKWYAIFDFVIQRGPYITKYARSAWLPLSITDEFYSDPEVERINKIVFMGNTRGKVYLPRRRAISCLEKTRVFSNYGFVGETEYPGLLRKYVGAYTCTGLESMRQPLAKHFEYGASGTAILTPPFFHGEVLFGTKQCWFEYKHDISNIIDVAMEVVFDKDKNAEVTNNMLKVIKKYHTDKDRIVELDNILRALVSGNPIPRKWEV